MNGQPDYLERVTAILDLSRRAASALRAAERGWDWGEDEDLTTGYGQRMIDRDVARIDATFYLLALNNA